MFLYVVFFAVQVVFHRCVGFFKSVLFNIFQKLVFSEGGLFESASNVQFAFLTLVYRQ